MSIDLDLLTCHFDYATAIYCLERDLRLMKKKAFLGAVMRDFTKIYCKEKYGRKFTSEMSDFLWLCLKYNTSVGNVITFANHFPF